MNSKYFIKTILAVCFIVALLPACVKYDNYEGPDASLSGNVFQDGSTDLVQTCTGNFSIRLEQLSWSNTPSPQSIPIKFDGTYENTKLFSGHYRVSIFGGAFWPADPIEMDIKSGAKQDFTLTPYLILSNFTVDVIDSATVKLQFHMDAPQPGIPKILEIQPYVNTTQIVGPGAAIFNLSDANKITLGKEWADFADNDKNQEITISGMIPGRTFYIRAGVKFDNNDKSSNLTNVIKVTMPNG